MFRLIYAIAYWRRLCIVLGFIAAFAAWGALMIFAVNPIIAALASGDDVAMMISMLASGAGGILVAIIFGQAFQEHAYINEPWYSFKG